jgi:uncharacterized protein (TIGR02001 family)
MYSDRRRNRPTITLAALPLLCLAGAAAAQTSANLALVSEYAARGLALSNGPVPQLRVDHDTDSGWYAGGFASPVKLYGRGQGQFIAYAGRAGRLTPDLSWDAGVTRTVFLRDGAWNYHEFYAGMALRRVSARIFYSPAYYGMARSAYLDVSGAYGLADHLSLAAHAGVFHAFEDYAFGATSRNRMDARLVLAASSGDYSLQAGLQRQWNAQFTRVRHARGFVASVSRNF